MATSGSTDFTMTSRDICTTALRMIGVCAATRSPSGAQAASAMQQLTLLLKTWATVERLWLVEQGSIACVQGQAAYSLPLARRVLSVRRRTSNLDTPLCELSREEYYDLPTKSAQGFPNNWYFDPQRTTRTLYIWQTPDAYNAANTTLKYTYARVVDDIDDLNDEADVPQEWLDALTYGLAKRMGPQFGVAGDVNYQEIKAEAERLYAELTADSQETAPVYFQPAQHF
jgi:hypothetical protein